MPALHQGTERSPGEQQQTYQKRLSEIETLQEHIKRDQIKYEHERNEYEYQIDKKKDHVEQLKNDYVRLVKEIASKAVFSRSGKAISNQVNLPFYSKGQHSASHSNEFHHPLCNFPTGLAYTAKKFFTCGYFSPHIFFYLRHA